MKTKTLLFPCAALAALSFASSSAAVVAAPGNNGAFAVIGSHVEAVQTTCGDKQFPYLQQMTILNSTNQLVATGMFATDFVHTPGRKAVNATGGTCTGANGTTYVLYEIGPAAG